MHGHGEQVARVEVHVEVGIGREGPWVLVGGCRYGRVAREGDEGGIAELLTAVRVAEAVVVVCSEVAIGAEAPDHHGSAPLHRVAALPADRRVAGQRRPAGWIEL